MSETTTPQPLAATPPGETSAAREAAVTALLLRLPALLGAASDIQGALDRVAEALTPLLPFTHADVCLHDGPEWSVSYEVGISTHWSARRTRLDCSPIRSVLDGSVPLMVSANALLDPRQIFAGACCEPIFAHQLRSRVHVALRSGGQVIGALSVSHREADHFEAADVALIQRLAAPLAPVFHALHGAAELRQQAHGRSQTQASEEWLRQGSLQLTQALEQARQRIGMDLHDQTLADLTRLLRELEGAGPPPSREALAQALAQSIDDLRCIIDRTAPKLLDLFGFHHAVRDHLERATEGERIQILVEDLTAGAPDRLPGETRTALYRIVQEAINNAARHARAERIEVHVTLAAENTLCVSVDDDGQGLANAGTRQSGLVHMRTRARLIGATLDIFEHVGTRVAVRLALPPREIAA
ncbi:GAF domain-containing sensor histidine kinase [Salinicola endophyticus]|uniref:GAF domain-containing sensor histidine kinase n=1 Tax=Salinicola endophyticus TaxID=1949083 RepID=UPI001CB6F958|nr:ATP-binding protein [Salinicola endophyticus]